LAPKVSAWEAAAQPAKAVAAESAIKDFFLLMI
jgi:hypothetical protein